MVEKEKEIDLNFAPNLGLKCLQFNQIMMEGNGFLNLGTNEATDWTEFENEHLGLSIYTEDNLIVSFSFFISCKIDGIELIGNTIMNYIELFHITKYSITSEDLTLQDGEYLVYDIDGVGIQFWTKGGVIKSVHASLE